MQSKPMSAGDSKSTVSTYAAVIRYTTVVEIEALMCSLPVLLCPAIHIPTYVGVHPPRTAFDNSTSTYITAMTIPPFRQADYPSTLQLFYYSRNTVR